MNRPNTVAHHDSDRRAPSFGRAVVLTSASTLVAMLAYSGPLGNAPSLLGALAAAPSASTWILSSMSLGLAVSLLSLGALADDFGRRRVFTLGAWLFAAGSAVCGVANGATLFVVGRLVEGVGAAGMIATGLGLVAAATHHAGHRATAASWWGASMGAGVALGPLLTGMLDLGGQWRLFYWLLVAAGTGVALAAPRLFSETTTVARGRVDTAGLTTMTGGLGLLVVALVEARQGDGVVAGACAVPALLLIAGFVATQLRGRNPMLDVTLFRCPAFVAATVAALATGGGVIALMSYACSFLVTGMHLTTLEAGVLLTVWSGTSVVSAVLSRLVLPRLTGQSYLAIGLVGAGGGMLLLTALSTTSTPWRLVPGLLVAGLASGILNAGLGRQAVASVPAERAALGTGTNNTARYVGASIGVTIVSILAADPGGGRADLATGWNQATLVAAGVSVAGAVVVLMTSRFSRAG